MTRTWYVAALLVATLSVPAHASVSARFGIEDDAWLMYGPGTLQQRIATLDDLGVGIVRLTIRWDEIAPTEPLEQRNPADPAYRWGAYATVLEALRADHIPVVVTLWGSPRWANGNRAPNWLPRSGFGNFAYAASRRFPWVHLWTIWNEPNTGRFARPVSPTLYTRRLLNPAYALLHRANRANQVAGGVTSPRNTPSGMSPYGFMVGMHRAHARLDAYAHNPYPTSPRSTPSHPACTPCRTLTMARLPLILKDVTRLFGHKPIWLTEYGYQTNPPDALYGVPPAVQAKYIGQAALRVWQDPRVAILIHFLVRDEPSLGGWQSGFFTVHGAAKPSYRAFGLPLAQVSRSGNRTTVWGEVRPGSGRRRYKLERWTGSRWAVVGSSWRTTATGAFMRAIRAHKGEKIRLSAPGVDYSSPILVVS